jgi:hypothetical protein
MSKGKLIGSMIGAIAMAISASPMVASAAAITAGLSAISVRGVGPRLLAAGTCAAIACEDGHVCECFSGVESLVGNVTYSQLTFALSIDTTDTSLPISNVGDCLPATGRGTLSSSSGKNTITLDISGLACPTLTEDSAETGQVQSFNGTYVVTGGTAPGKQTPVMTGVGTVNGAVNTGASSTTAYVSLAGSVQK